MNAPMALRAKPQIVRNDERNILDKLTSRLIPFHRDIARILKYALDSQPSECDQPSWKRNAKLSGNFRSADESSVFAGPKKQQNGLAKPGHSTGGDHLSGHIDLYVFAIPVNKEDKDNEQIQNGRREGAEHR